MSLKRKLEIIGLPSKEEEKVVGKRLATLSLVTEEELEAEKAFLTSYGILVTDANAITVYANPKDKMADKISVIDAIHELDLYRQSPVLLNKNAIDIYKKINYCIQIGKSYKRADGTYEPFLFSELAWQREMNKKPDLHVVETSVPSPTEEFVTLEPVTEPILQIIEPAVPQVEEEPFVDPNHMDIKKYREMDSSSVPTNDTANLEAITTSFADIKKSLEDQFAMFENLNSGMEDEISFNDFNGLEPESYEMRRRA